MNAYKSYQQRNFRNQQREIIMENCRAYIEHMDLIVLDILHTDFGFGSTRLERMYREIEKRYEAYKRYLADDDKTHFNSEVDRDDTYALKKRLREIGFDYDKIVREMTEEET